MYGKTSDHVLGLKGRAGTAISRRPRPVTGQRLADKLALETREGDLSHPSIASAASGAPTSKPPS